MEVQDSRKVSIVEPHPIGDSHSIRIILPFDCHAAFAADNQVQGIVILRSRRILHELGLDRSLPLGIEVRCSQGIAEFALPLIRGPRLFRSTHQDGGEHIALVRLFLGGKRQHSPGLQLLRAQLRIGAERQGFVSNRQNGGAVDQLHGGEAIFLGLLGGKLGGSRNDSLPTLEHFLRQRKHVVLVQVCDSGSIHADRAQLVPGVRADPDRGGKLLLRQSPALGAVQELELALILALQRHGNLLQGPGGNRILRLLRLGGLEADDDVQLAVCQVIRREIRLTQGNADILLTVLDALFQRTDLHTGHNAVPGCLKVQLKPGKLFQVHVKEILVMSVAEQADFCLLVQPVAHRAVAAAAYVDPQSLLRPCGEQIARQHGEHHGHRQRDGQQSVGNSLFLTSFHSSYLPSFLHMLDSPDHPGSSAAQRLSTSQSGSETSPHPAPSAR